MHSRAIAFALSKFLTEEKLGKVPKVLTLSLLHRPWKPSGENENNAPSLGQKYSATTTLEIISALITNTYPSRILLSTLLSPIIAPLYTLFAYLKQQRASDPTVLELCRSLFITWAKIAEVEEAREIVWSIVEGQGGIWTVEDGEVKWLNQ
jgi:hypothetical protein